jgi:activator of HSP90 ATPase
MNSINYGAYEPYNHHQAEAEIRQWAQEYAEEKQNGAPMATLESYLNDMINETQKYVIILL